MLHVYKTRTGVVYKIKHAREFKEAWYSVDKNAINPYIDIPPVFLQLKHFSDVNNCNQRPPAVNDPATMTTTHPATTSQTPQSAKKPIRRSRRIQKQKEQREN